jgi:hypothetical protein
MFLLDSMAEFILPDSATPPVPGKVAGKNRLSIEARVAIALRLLRGDSPNAESAIARAAHLCRVRRAKIDQHLKRHSNVGEALARAFRRASAKDRIAFIRCIGCEKIWNTLTQAAN